MSSPDYTGQLPQMFSRLKLAQQANLLEMAGRGPIFEFFLPSHEQSVVIIFFMEKCFLLGILALYHSQISISVEIY